MKSLRHWKSRCGIFIPAGNIPWKVTDIANALTQPTSHSDELETLVNMIATEAKPTDHILVMSNGSFGGIHQKF